MNIKKISKRTQIILIAANMIIMGALIGFAAMQLFVPATAVITTGSIALFTDGACQNPATSADFGNVVPGQSSRAVLIYVKNIGNMPVDVVATLVSADPAITLQPSGQGYADNELLAIQPGVCGGAVTIYLNATLEAVPGPVSGMQVLFTGSNVE